MRRLPALLCGLLLCVACSEPPRKELDRAQAAVDRARQAGADEYAHDAFASATTALQAANDAVTQRDYRLALSHAIDASERADEAARQAESGRNAARAEAERALTAARAARRQLEARITTARLPRRDLQSSTRLLHDADIALQEARTEVDAGHYVKARDALKALTSRITAQIGALELASRGRAARQAKKRR
jgi:hypothetical protein